MLKKVAPPDPEDPNFFYKGYELDKDVAVLTTNPIRIKRKGYLVHFKVTCDDPIVYVKLLLSNGTEIYCTKTVEEMNNKIQNFHPDIIGLPVWFTEEVFLDLSPEQKYEVEFHSLKQPTDAAYHEACIKALIPPPEFFSDETIETCKLKCDVFSIRLMDGKYIIIE